MKTIQVRNVPDDVHRALRTRAAAAGVSLSDFALGELERVARRPPVADLLARARARAGGTDEAAIVAAVREGRDREQRVLVLDTSAALAALLARDAPTRLVELLSEDGDLHAPHLIDVEVLHALRRLVKTRAVALDRAIDARTDFAELALTRYPHLELSDRMWDLRHNLTAYAAAFVALAETLGVPLATCDARLASAPHDAHVQLFATQGRGCRRAQARLRSQSCQAILVVLEPRIPLDDAGGQIVDHRGPYVTFDARAAAGEV